MNLRRIPMRVAVAFAIAVGLFITAGSAAAAEPKRLSKKEVKALIAKANSSEDHMQLARYYRAEAERLEAEAADHDDMAAQYRKRPVPAASKTPMHPASPEHCEYFAKALREAANAARQLAAGHEQTAKDAQR
jgi:hypothetical protein